MSTRRLSHTLAHSKLSLTTVLATLHVRERELEELREEHARVKNDASRLRRELNQANSRNAAKMMDVVCAAPHHQARVPALIGPQFDSI